jgi:hypothetical protein
MDAIVLDAQRDSRDSYSDCIDFQKEMYCISARVMQSQSQPFADHRYARGKAPYEIKSAVLKSAVIQFLNPFRGIRWQISADVVHDFIELSDELRIGSLREEANRFIRDNVRICAIAGMKRAVERNLDPSHFEQELRVNFIEFVTDPALLDLPVCHLARIAALPLSPTPDQVDTFFALCLRVLDRYGLNGSPVLRNFESGFLTGPRWAELESRSVNWAVLGWGGPHPTVRECLNLDAKLTQMIRAERSEREAAVRQLIDENDQLKSVNSDLRSKTRAQADEISQLNEANQSIRREIAGLRQELKAQQSEASRTLVNGQQVHHFYFHRRSPLLGMLSYLAGPPGAGASRVTITASSVHRQGRVWFRPESVIDSNPATSFNSIVGDGQWICFDFGKARVIPAAYSIRSIEVSPGHVHLKSWRIDGSLDAVTWFQLDKQVDCTELNEVKTVVSFAISAPKECRFVRLFQTGPNWKGLNFITLSAFELFGELRE